VIVRKQYLNCHLRNSRKLKGAGEQRDGSSLPRLEPSSTIPAWAFLVQLTPTAKKAFIKNFLVLPVDHPQGAFFHRSLDVI
jgi:hypothetical protein